MMQKLEKIKGFKTEILLILALFIMVYTIGSYVITPVIQDDGGKAMGVLAAAATFLTCPILAGAYGGYIIAKKDRGNISLLLPGAVIAAGLILANIPQILTWSMMSDAEFKTLWENSMNALDNETRAIYEENGLREYDPRYKNTAISGHIFSLIIDMPIVFALGAAGASVGRKISTGR